MNTKMTKEEETILALLRNPTTEFRLKCLSRLMCEDRSTGKRKLCYVGLKGLLRGVTDCLLKVGDNKLPADHELIIMIEEICRQLLVEEPYDWRNWGESLRLEERYKLCLTDEKHNIDQTYLTSGKIPHLEICVLIDEVTKPIHKATIMTNEHRQLYIYLYLTRQALTK